MGAVILPMILRVSGTYTFMPPFDIPTLTEKGEIILQAETGSGAVIINLPPIESFGGGQLAFRVKVDDYGNNSSNNMITVNAYAGETIGGQSSLIINSDGQTVEFYMTGPTKWATNIANSLSPIFSICKEMSSAEILALNTTPFVLVNALGSGKVAKLVSLVSTLNFNSVAYAMGGGGIVDIFYGSFDTGQKAFNNTFLTSGVKAIEDDSLSAIQAIGGASSAYSNYNNQPLQLKATAAITNGNSPITVCYSYQIQEE